MNPPLNTPWYKETKEVHRSVFATVKIIERGHSTRCAINSKYLALYEDVNTRIPGMLQPGISGAAERPSFNVISSVIDTAASKIAASKPRPEFNTQEGDFRLQREASLLTQFNDGVFYENKTYSVMQDCFIDAALWGTAAVQVFASGNSIINERVRIDELLVDDYEGQYRRPKNLFHQRRLYRDTLIQRAENEGWSKDAVKAIKNAPTAEKFGFNSGDSNSQNELISVVEAWHLGTKGNDGKYHGGKTAVCIEGYTLSFDDYNLPDFPFVFFRWAEKRFGFYGSGLAEKLIGLQLEIAKVLKHIAIHMRQTGVKVFVSPGSMINPNHLGQTNIPIIEAVDPPTPITFPAVAQETYEYLNLLYEKAFETTGISQVQASATKEAGIDSNAALVTMNDNQSARFQLIQQRFEQFALDIAGLNISTAKSLFTSPEYKADKTSANAELVKHINWKKEAISDSTYSVQCFPVSAFTTAPAARLQQIQDVMKIGAMQPKMALQLMGDNPDYREWETLETASLQRVQKYLDLMKHERVYNPPDEYLDLNEAMTLVDAEINRSIVQEVPEANIALMRDFKDECKMQLASQQAPPPSAPAMPQAQPEALPTSPMLPMGGQ